MVLSSYTAAARGARIDQEKGRRESHQVNFGHISIGTGSQKENLPKLKKGSAGKSCQKVPITNQCVCWKHDWGEG